MTATINAEVQHRPLDNADLVPGRLWRLLVDRTVKEWNNWRTSLIGVRCTTEHLVTEDDRSATICIQTAVAASRARWGGGCGILR